MDFFEWILKVEPIGFIDKLDVVRCVGETQGYWEFPPSFKT